MKTKTTLLELMHETLAECGGEDLVLLDDYSGRGMHGKLCIGITGEDYDVKNFLAQLHGSIIEKVFEAAMDGTEEEAWAARDLTHEWIELLLTGLAIDSFGSSNKLVYYWPQLQAPQGLQS